MTDKLNNHLSDDELFCIGLEEERKRRSLKKPTYVELLQIFPDMEETFQEKITEWQEVCRYLKHIVKRKIQIINTETKDELARWFYKKVYVEMEEVEKLIEIERHITRLQQMLLLTKGRTPKGRITDLQIQQAKTVPLESVYAGELQKKGSSLKGLCPFHDDSHPSFYIYISNNIFVCYACDARGDVIAFVQRLYGYSFPEAVRHLSKINK